ncbi:MAG TPA: PmoA family protein [Tepidisphaeraceae bacterium]|jgi:hypothetical protein
MIRISAVLTSLCLIAFATYADPAVKIEQKEDALVITVDGKPFTTYRFAQAADDPDWHRPYFYPVLSADGVEITSDQWRLQQKQPDEAARKKIDHPHQRSVWVGHGDVNGADHWTHKQFKQHHLKFISVRQDGFVEELAWDGKEPGKPVLNETRTVRIVAYPDGARAIDVTSAFTAANGDVIFKVKPLNVTGVEAGWLAARVAPSISDGIKNGSSTITTSAGTNGEKASREKPSNWCDYSGLIDGKTYGIALFDHPTNPGHPTPFHVRAFGLLTHIGIHDWTLKAGQTQAFHYRLLFHAGDAKSAKLDERYKEFAGQ